MKKAIFYTRVSTEDQAENGFSLDHQEKLIKLHCKTHQIQIMNSFTEDHSAKDFNRPEWKKLMEYVQINKKVLDCIIFTKWDRFSRNAGEAIQVIKKLRNYGIDVVCLEYPLDFDVPENKLMLAMLLTIPEVENDKNSLRTKEGMREARKQGFWTGKAPFGYTNKRDTNGKSTLEINDKGLVVKEAFELISTGLYTCEEVRRRTIKECKHKMCKQAFLNMLNNISYTGRVVVAEWKKEDYQIAEGVHEAIVSPELFDRVQDVLKGRRKQPKLHMRKMEILPLRGHLKCPKCEGNLTGSGSTSRDRKKYFYYHCQRGCKVRFRADEANNKFLEYLSSIKISQPVKDMYQKIMNDVYKQKVGDKNAKIVEVQEMINKIKLRIENLQDSFADNQIAATEFNSMRKRYDEQITRKEIELQEVKTTDATFVKYMDFTLQLIEKIDYFYDMSPVEVKGEIIVSMFPEKLIFDNKKYRTTKTNEVVSVITRKDNITRGDKKERASKNADSSTNAPSAGLEPATP